MVVFPVFLPAGLLLFWLMFGEVFEIWSVARSAKRAAKRAAMNKWEVRFRLLRNLAIFAYFIAWVHHLFA